MSTSVYRHLFTSDGRPTSWIGSCCTVAASSACCRCRPLNSAAESPHIALVFYYHASTLAKEVEFMWGRKRSSVTALFHANRWAIFLWAVQEITSLIPLKTLSVSSHMSLVAKISLINKSTEVLGSPRPFKHITHYIFAISIQLAA